MVFEDVSMTRELLQPVLIWLDGRTTDTKRDPPENTKILPSFQKILCSLGDRNRKNGLLENMIAYFVEVRITCNTLGSKQKSRPSGPALSAPCGAKYLWSLSKKLSILSSSKRPYNCSPSYQKIPVLCWHQNSHSRPQNKAYCRLSNIAEYSMRCRSYPRCT